MYDGYFKASGTTSIENYSKLTHCEAPIPEGSKPFLPCLLITCGSGSTILKVSFQDKFKRKTRIHFPGIRTICVINRAQKHLWSENEVFGNMTLILNELYFLMTLTFKNIWVLHKQIKVQAEQNMKFNHFSLALTHLLWRKNLTNMYSWCTKINFLASVVQKL